MGVSFKVAKTGTRYRPKLLQIEDNDNENGSVTESQKSANEGNITEKGAKAAEYSNSFTKPTVHSVSEDLEVSFSLNLFPNGFSFGNATEVFNDEPKQLHPYDRGSKTLFSAIEYGCLPGDLLDDIPCKYVNGALLCEIRDYRNLWPQKGGPAASVEKSSIVHKVLLHICMENVVKDISLIADDSWTYEDILEIESRILKALQPDLHLNPDPLQDRHRGELLAKKLNLGIAWSWKKRRLGDTIAIHTSSRNPNNVTQISSSCDIQNSISQSGFTYQDRVTCLQENNVLPETTSQSNLLMVDNQLADSCNQSVSIAQKKSSFVRVPYQDCSNTRSNSTKAISSISGKKGRCETEALQEYIPIKLKQEPVDFSQQQLPGGQAKSILAHELLRENTLLHQQIMAEKLQDEKNQHKSHPSLLINSGQPFLEGIPRLLAGMPTCTVKQEPAESSFFSSDVRKINDNCFQMDKRITQSNLQQLEQQQLSALLRANTPSTHSSCNRVTQPVNKSLRNESATQKRKALQNPQVSAGIRSATLSSQQDDSWAREASIPAKGKLSYQNIGSNMKVVGSLARTCNLNAVNGNILPAGNLPSFKPPETKVDPVIERLLKIEGITQRYGLNYKKHKLDPFLRRKPSFHTNPLVAFHLSSSEDNRKSKDDAINKVPPSKCSIERRFNVCKSRTLTFVRQCHVNDRNVTPMVDREAQITLFISETLNEGILEASLYYGDEGEIGSFVIPLFFSSTHSMDIFASQFTSLMLDEGYRIASDRVEPTALHTGGDSSSHSRVINNATPATGTAELPAPALISGLSPLMDNPMTASLSAHNATRLPSQNILSRANLLPPENIWSTIRLPGGWISKSQLDIAAPVSAPQWQMILSNRARLQLQMQMQQRERQQEIMQGNLLAGGLGVAAGGLGTVQPNCGIQGLGDVNIGSFSNLMGVGGSSPMLMGGFRTWIGSGSQSSNICSNISGSSESKQLLGLINHAAVDTAKMRTAETQGRASVGVVPLQRNSSGMPMDALNPQSMAYNFNNQWQPQLQLQEHLRVLQSQEDMKSLLQPPALTSLVENVGLPTSQVTLQRSDDQPPMSPSN
ncbi:protein PHYTOCHROME-DEPENDENT LATE-FLOWERING-like isoform X1 [Juglans microcarpa x Juglans regia]|uniref:protein PHYTOCHROME-DEPENDENT LATE-FLOWERING-like isoform X1 n=1 Tax=Juglans microcarpa x Juglans regia TaxID=2249226 RepID=UPI001B7E9C50|nr:protein PHYTOCHROME-DEPENDENT LATE-FLOWERING-like isoform X1 [Juglans microcarpa x Juglans regia]